MLAKEDNIKILMGHSVETLRKMQDKNSAMFEAKNAGKWVVFSIEELQTQQLELTEAVYRKVFG